LSKNSIDIAALLIATLAVVISLIQMKTQKNLEITNKQPLLAIEFLKVDEENKKGFTINNFGLGPAIIDSFCIYKNQRDYEKGVKYHEWLDSSNFFILPLTGKFEPINNLEPGFILASGRTLFLVGTDTSSFYCTTNARYLDSTIVELKYRSISSIDDNIYYLKFCELFKTNNSRKEGEKNYYEYEK